MTNIEFNEQFDILYNNIMSNAAPNVNEYEKSVFLTKAQNEIVKNYFNDKGNKYRTGYDSSSKRQVDFSTLTKIVELTRTNVTFLPMQSHVGCEYPSDLFLFLHEIVIIKVNNILKKLQVLPIDYITYSQKIYEPFKWPLKHECWRLLNYSANTLIAELIALNLDTTFQKYVVRYLKKPRPIVLVDLTSFDVTVDGVSNISTCELPEILHEEILQRAVEIAKYTYYGNHKETVEIGNRSE